MGLSFRGVVVGAVGVCAMTLCAIPAYATARELATAQGAIAISEAHSGLRAPSCSELVVEARDALDNHLIAETQPLRDEAGACMYTLSVPAQTAVWLRVQLALVAGTRVINGADAVGINSGRPQSLRGSVALRFTIIAPTTFFLAPNEHKTMALSY